MGMKRFKLRAYNEKEYFWVYVYDSLQAMRSDGEKFSGEKLGDAWALVQPYQRIKIEKDGAEETSNEIGTVRLVKGKIQTHIIAHELIHVAMWHYRLTQKNRKANFGENCNDDEEAFGMIYAKYFSKMNRQLYKHKLWEN